MVTLVLVCFQPTQQCQHHQHHPVCVVVFTTCCHTLHMRCTTPLNHLVSVSQTKPFDALAPIPFAINPHQPLCFTAFHLATSTHRWMEDTDDGWQSVMVKANTRLTKHSHNSHHQQWAEPQTPCLQSLAINTKHKWWSGHKVVE